ncbi:MAG: hypothetical protein ACXWWE_05620 [Nitrospira sp.]
MRRSPGMNGRARPQCIRSRTGRRPPGCTTHRWASSPPARLTGCWWCWYRIPGVSGELEMQQVGLPYSGKYGFVESKMYSAIHHEVVPAQKALGCSDCRSVEAVTCTRCQAILHHLRPRHAAEIVSRFRRPI